MRYWCVSTSPENWQICKENGLWGMDERYFVTLEKFLKPGDKAVVYNHGGMFVAVVKFINDYFHDETPIGWKKGSKEFLFPYRIPFKIIYESKNPPRISFSTEEENNKAQWNRTNLIDEIEFIADKGRTRHQYVQVSIIRITEGDFNTISKAIIES